MQIFYSYVVNSPFTIRLIFLFLCQVVSRSQRFLIITKAARSDDVSKFSHSEKLGLLFFFSFIVFFFILFLFFFYKVSLWDYQKEESEKI